MNDTIHASTAGTPSGSSLTQIPIGSPFTVTIRHKIDKTTTKDFQITMQINEGPPPTVDVTAIQFPPAS